MTFLTCMLYVGLVVTLTELEHDYWQWPPVGGGTRR
jgi:hypothetical protein